jgi:HIV Tat-specific factor 1
MRASTVWVFLSPEGQQQGPVSTDALLKMIADGVLNGSSFVWNPSMAEWSKASDTEELKLYVPTLWCYINGAGVQLGPVDEMMLQKDLRSGNISPSTMVWTDGMDQWAALAQVPTLMERLCKPAPVPVVASPRSSSKTVFAKPLPRVPSISGGSTLRPASPTGAAKRRRVSTPTVSSSTSVAGAAARDRSDSAAAAGPPLKKKRKRKKKAKKRVVAPLTMIYIQNLPLDVTESEVAALFGKYGIITLGDEGEPKVKLYRDAETGKAKGDGTVHYLKDPSVALAVQLADGMTYRGSVLRVERAQRKAKLVVPGGCADGGSAAAKPKQKLTKHEARLRQLRREYQERALGWSEGGDMGVKIAVLFGAFAPAKLRAAGLAESAGRNAFVDELRGDIESGCDDLGQLKKVTVCEQSDEGVVLVTYRTGEGAAACVSKMNGRFFDGTKLRAELWDGFSNFVGEKKKESERAQRERMESFGDWLEGGGSGSDGGENNDGGDSGGGGGGGDAAAAAAVTPHPPAKPASGAEGDSARAALVGYLLAVQETVRDPEIRVRREAHVAARAHTRASAPAPACSLARPLNSSPSSPIASFPTIEINLRSRC